MNIPIVKEHGSWVVFLLSSIAGIFTGISESVDSVNYPGLFLVILGLAFLINSKRPLTSALRSGMDRRVNIRWFLTFNILGLLMLIPLMIKGVTSFLIFIPLIAAYAILLAIGKEHSLIAELTGFALLSVSAPILYFVLTGELSLRLYVIVMLFFCAGVFKVRLRVRRGGRERVMMLIYCIGVFIAFRNLDISTITLLPLSENILTSLWIREERLKTTGQIELLKGIIFTSLLIWLWNKSTYNL